MNEQKVKNGKWPWWMVILWIYSTIIGLISFGFNFFASKEIAQTANQLSSADAAQAGLILAPLPIFLILIGIRNFKTK